MLSYKDKPVSKPGADRAGFAEGKLLPNRWHLARLVGLLGALSLLGTAAGISTAFAHHKSGHGGDPSCSEPDCGGGKAGKAGVERHETAGIADLIPGAERGTITQPLFRGTMPRPARRSFSSSRTPVTRTSPSCSVPSGRISWRTHRNGLSNRQSSKAANGPSITTPGYNDPGL